MGRLGADRGRIARVLGLALIVAGVVAFFLVPGAVAWTLVFAGVSTGAFLSLVAGAPSVPASVVPALVEGPAEDVASLLDAFALNGRAVFVPPGGNLTRDRVFIPASENEKPVPLLDDASTIHRGPVDFKIGVALVPAGRALIDAHVDATGASLAGAPLPEVEGFLRGLGLENGLFTGLRLTRVHDSLVVAFSPRVATPCFGAMSTSPPCDRGGCALCSAVGCALARSVDRPLAVHEAGPDGSTIVMTFDAPPPAEDPAEASPDPEERE